MKVKIYAKKIINLYYTTPVQIKASIWFVMSTILLKGISFITVPIFTRVMTTEQYGIYSVYLTWCEIFTILGTLSIESCAYVSVLTKFEAEKEEAQISLLELAFFLTSILLFVILLVGRNISNIIGLPEDLLMLMIVQIYFVPAVNFWSIKNRFLYKYKSLVFVSVSMAILNASIGVIFVMNSHTENQALVRVISIVVVQVVYGIFLFSRLVKKSRFQISFKYWRWGLKLHLPLLPHTLSLKILAGADRIMINAMIGATAAALYSVSYSIAVVINILKTSIVDAIRPWIYTSLRAKKTDDIKQVTNGVLLLLSILILIFVAFAPEVIWVVAPSNYYEAINCMPPVIISSFFTFLYSIFSIIEMYFEETKKLMVASIITSVLNILLNAIFIKICGYVAAAFTTLVCYSILAMIHYIMARKILKNNGIKMQLFDAKLIIFLCIGLLAFMFIFEILYLHTMLRYFFLLIMLAVLVCNRKYFINMIKIIQER